MQERKEKLLKGIIDRYVATAEAVGSQVLINFLDLAVSSATVRNDLKELEEEGYVIQPHTSAGRVPTAKAYRYYVEHFLVPSVPAQLLGFMQEKKGRGDEPERAVKIFAKLLAAELYQAVFVVFTKDQSYYTGLSNLFGQPEFAAQGTVQNVTSLLDRFDEVAQHLFRFIEDKDLHVHIGPGNPFGNECTIMYIPFVFKRGERSLLGILGPTRMDYNATIGSMKAAKTYLDTL